jgi:hypothetical protein
MNWPFWRKPKRYIRLYNHKTGELLIIGGDVEPKRISDILHAFDPDLDVQGVRDAFAKKYGWDLS